MSNDPKTAKVDMEKLIKGYINNHKLVAKYRNDNQSSDYVKGYKDGYNKAIENLLNNIHML